MNPVFLDGQYGTTEDMKVSVLDRGYLFGDGVYEVYRLYGNQAFTRELHLARLERSLKGIELFIPYSPVEFRAILDRMEAASPANSYIYIHVTRGVAPRSHAFPAEPKPSLMVMAVPMGGIPAELFRAGIGLRSQLDDRWLHCTVKSLNLLANCRAMTMAHRDGAFEALLIGADGIVNESAASSFFAVVDGVVRTAPLDRNILPGVTRHIILDLCRANGIACEERAVSLDELAGASEAFISNSAYEILPVTRIDAATVGQGAPGPAARRLMALFAAKVAAETGGKAECAKGLA